MRETIARTGEKIKFCGRIYTHDLTVTFSISIYGHSPAHGQVSLSSQGHGEVGRPGHQDVLQRVPQVGEH